ncbi:MAG: hypothetical protein OXT69_14050 [Candidatus Poribacteria bacterium]|nr:hypothetical protein [Candidatus Poribacteria bacterium]
MRRYAPSTALTFAVTAAVVCLAPIRADAENFTLELQAAVYEMTQRTEHRMRGEPGSVMFKDMHALVTDVGNQLLLRNEQLKKENVPVNERLPKLRQLYLTEMRKLHELTPDGSSSVKYNERKQTLMCYHYHITSSGYSGGGGGGTFASRLNSVLKFHMIERDPFAFNLNAALSDLENNWRSFKHANLGLLISHIHRHRSPGSPTIPSILPGLTPTPSPISPLEYPRGIESMIANIDYELSKLNVELSLKGRSDEERAEKLGRKLIEIVRKFDKQAPLVQFDETAAEFSFYDSSGRQQLDAFGAPLTYKFPSTLMSTLSIKTSGKTVDSGIRRFMIGAAAVVLLLFGGIYLAMKFGSSQEENEGAEEE